MDLIKSMVKTYAVECIKDELHFYVVNSYYNNDDYVIKIDGKKYLLVDYIVPFYKPTIHGKPPKVILTFKSMVTGKTIEKTIEVKFGRLSEHYSKYRGCHTMYYADHDSFELSFHKHAKIRLHNLCLSTYEEFVEMFNFIIETKAVRKALEIGNVRSVIGGYNTICFNQKIGYTVLGI